MDADRQYAVASLLFEYVKSPSLRHLRDAHCIHKLAREIVTALDRGTSTWKKWGPEREEVAKAAVSCWIPVEDILAFLDTLPGRSLTKTDVEQRLRTISEEPYTTYPKDDLEDGCLALYQSGKARGTEIRAIIGALQEYVDREEDRRRREQQERYQRSKEEERLKLEQRFVSGADCGWTPIGTSDGFYCRRNGRAFRVTRGKDSRWTLVRVKDSSDKGKMLGTYQGRREASAALKTIAYAPEPQE